MHASTDLVKVFGQASWRLQRIRCQILVAAVANARFADVDLRVSVGVIEAQNVWANFLRSYLLSYLTAPRRRRGDRVRLGNLSAATPGDLLHIAAKACKGAAASAPLVRRDEPAWHDISNFLRACKALGPTNLKEVEEALSTQTRVFTDLPAFRNFYAHRNEESCARALGVAQRQYLIAGVKHPTEALLKTVKNRPQALILDWLDEMEIVMGFLCD